MNQKGVVWTAKFPKMRGWFDGRWSGDRVFVQTLDLITVIDAKTGKIVERRTVNHAGGRLSPDGTRLYEEGLIDVATNAALKRPLLKKTELFQFLPDGRACAAAYGKTISILANDATTALAKLEPGFKIGAFDWGPSCLVAISPDSTALTVWTNDELGLTAKKKIPESAVKTKAKPRKRA